MFENIKNTIIDKSKTSEYLETLVFTIEKENLLSICNSLMKDIDLQFDYLMCISGVDYKEYFEAVYHIYSMNYGYKVVLKVKLDKIEPNVDSVSSIWKTADWLERETYDLLGIKFNNHPDLRRILLPNDWEGYPLRKDYQHKPDKYD